MVTEQPNNARTNLFPLTSEDANMKVSDILMNSREWNYSGISFILPVGIRDLIEYTYLNSSHCWTIDHVPAYGPWPNPT